MEKLEIIQKLNQLVVSVLKLAEELQFDISIEDHKKLNGLSENLNYKTTIVIDKIGYDFSSHNKRLII